MNISGVPFNFVLPFGDLGIVGIIIDVLYLVAVLCCFFSKNKVVLKASMIYTGIFTLIIFVKMTYIFVTKSPIFDFI